MATLAALRKEAKAAGIPAKAIRLAGSAAELSALIAGNGKPTKAVAKKAVKKASAVRKATATVKRGRGRPKGSVNKPKVSANKSATKKAPAAKSTRGKAKRPSNGDVGRALIDEDIDFSIQGEWEPREGSAPDRIIKTLKKHRGNREKAFQTLLPDIWDFMGKVKRNGEKRTKAEAQAMLKYRIARTLWDFCMKTGQHEVATNRIEYGTGPNAKPKRGRPKVKATVAAPKRRGRPPGTKNKPKATATVAKRGRPKGSKNKPAATTGKRRGRPPGSKNKPK